MIEPWNRSKTEPNGGFRVEPLALDNPYYRWLDCADFRRGTGPVDAGGLSPGTDKYSVPTWSVWFTIQPARASMVIVTYIVSKYGPDT